MTNDISPYRDETISHKPENIHTGRLVPLYRIYVKEAFPVFARHPDVRAMITVCAHFKCIITNFLMVTIYSI